jgi:NDP-sugar pyrophosphorylase family protein
MQFYWRKRHLALVHSVKPGGISSAETSHSNDVDEATVMGDDGVQVGCSLEGPSCVVHNGAQIVSRVEVVEVVRVYHMEVGFGSSYDILEVDLDEVVAVGSVVPEFGKTLKADI